MRAAKRIFCNALVQRELSRALMEAMSAGLPCIISNIRGNVDLIENGKVDSLINLRV